MTVITDSPAPPARRRQRSKATRRPAEERIAEILAAAREVLAERGYERTTTAEIAERANVVEGTLYRFFENKRVLFTRVAESWFEELLAEPHSRPGPEAGLRERMRAAIGRALTVICRERALSRFVLMEIRPDPGYKQTRIYALSRIWTQEISDLLHEARASGRLAPDLPIALVRDAVIGGIEHQVWAHLRNETGVDVATVAADLTRLLFDGAIRDGSADNRGKPKAS